MSHDTAVGDTGTRLKLRTHRDIIAGVAERWKAQYSHAGEWRNAVGNRAGAIYESLAALDTATATVDDIAAIIGNSSWTRNECASCGLEVSSAVAIVADEHSECGDTLICRGCLIAAVELLTSCSLPNEPAVGAQDSPRHTTADTSPPDAAIPSSLLPENQPE